MNLKTLLSIAAIAAVTQVTGCTMVPVTTNLDVPVAKTASATGPALKIVSVTDNRKFVYPHQADDCETPSTDGAAMLKDEAAKARAFSRQGRCEKGEWAQHAMVSVQPGQTVAGNVKEAVVTGLNSAGYRVINEDSSAALMEISVNKFWVARDLDGMGTRFWYEYDIDLDIDGKRVHLEQKQTDKYYMELGSGYYIKAANANIQSIIEDVQKQMSQQRVVAAK